MINSIVYNKFLEFISSKASCIARYNCVWETIPAENDTQCVYCFSSTGALNYSHSISFVNASITTRNVFPLKKK